MNKNQIILEHQREIARRGGLAKSERKAKSSAENGKKGGRPKKVKENCD